MLGQPKYSPAGIGDDCAVIQVGNETLALTCDTLNEEIHFSFATHNWEDVAWKLACASLSDLAAMGAQPAWGLLSLALPENVESGPDSLIRTLAKAAREYGFSLLGGDTTRSTDRLSLTLFLIGKCAHAPMLRSAATAGEILCVTGTLGASAAGLASLARGISTSAVGRHLRPTPRVAEGLLLASAGVKCCIDISDGLLGDTRHILAASEIGCEIYLDRIPVDPLATAAAEEIGADALEWAVSGGEDFQLLFTAPESLLECLHKEFESRKLAPICDIGKIQAGQGIRLIGPNSERYLSLTGYDHFASSQAANRGNC
jgi:thiamine-monophosphate kinase